jgi:hypothetical protein
VRLKGQECAKGLQRHGQKLKRLALPSPRRRRR